MISRFNFYLELAKERPEFRALCCYWEFDNITPDMSHKAEKLYRKRVKRDYKKLLAQQPVRISYFRRVREARIERSRQTAATRRAAGHRRRAAKIDATPAWFGEFDALVMKEAAVLCFIRESETGISWHIDHMIPLLASSVCGLHCADNIQVMPAVMNLDKRNKLTLTVRGEWLRVIRDDLRLSDV